MVDNIINEVKTTLENDMNIFLEKCKIYDWTGAYQFYKVKNRSSGKEKHFLHIKVFIPNNNIIKRTIKEFNFYFCYAYIDRKKRRIIKNKSFYELFEKFVLKCLSTKPRFLCWIWYCLVIGTCTISKISFAFQNKKNNELIFIIIFCVLLIVLAVFEGLEVVKRKEFFGWY